MTVGRAGSYAWSRMSLRGKGLVVIGLPVIVMLLALGVLAVSESQLRQAEARVAHTLQVRVELLRLRMTVRDADAAVASGLLTGQEELTAAAGGAAVEVTRLLDGLRALLGDDPAQAARVDRLRPVLAARLGLLGRVANLRGEAGQPPAVPLELLRQATVLERQANTLLEEMESVEQALLERRSRRAATTRGRQLALGLLAGSAGVGGAVAAMLLFTRSVVGSVRRLEDDARRMEQGVPLAPLDGGEDELARLRRTLHSTASLLAGQEQALREEARWLTSFVAAQQAITTGPLEVTVAAARVCAAARELTCARGAAAELLDGDDLVCCAGDGDLAGLVGRRTPVAGSPAAAAVAGAEPVPVLAEPEGHGLLLVNPLRHDDRTVGVLSILGDADAGFSDRDRHAASLLAGLLGVTVGRVRAEEALRAARDEAEAANRAKNEFLSRMSHELRTPLNAILGFGQLLQFDAATPEQEESVQQILRGGRHLLDLINEVLDITRIESGLLQMSVEPVDAREVLDDCLELMAPLATAAAVTLSPAAPSTCDLRVRADRQRLKQAMLNLLANAVKYNRAGGRIWLECSRVDDRVRLAVADTGIGIAPDHLDRLFRPFERLGAAETAVEGTGLGLALAKGLVEAMGGSLEVDPSRRDGATFVVELEAALPAPGVDDPEPAAPPADRRPDGARSAVVLYIEDNPSNVRLVERILAVQPGLGLLTAPDGRQGIEVACRQRPDLVLLDLHLPDMSGVDVLRELRSDERTAGIPVVVISADAMEARRSLLLEAGAAEYLTKPFDVATVRAVVRDLTSGG